jgi:hypothetical protein
MPLLKSSTYRDESALAYAVVGICRGLATPLPIVIRATDKDTASGAGLPIYRVTPAMATTSSRPCSARRYDADSTDANGETGREGLRGVFFPWAPHSVLTFTIPN